MTNGPLVSILIPTLNAAGTLQLTLDSVRDQTYKNIEVVIIDKNSTDETARIGREFGAQVYVIDASERCEQLNYGARMAKGEYVYRIDCDFILEKDVVEAAVRASETEGLDAVIVHNASDPRVGFWARVRQLERDCYKDDDLNVSARFMRKSSFQNIGGFDEKMVACEDYDIQNRMVKANYKIGRIGPKELHLGEPRTLGEIARKHYYYGKTLPFFVEKNRGMASKQLSPFRPSFFRNWKEFTRDPVLTCGFIIYQITKYYTAGLGYLVGKYGKKQTRG
jgi:glycosyltransferase involved in cell wall biosynthesis